MAEASHPEVWLHIYAQEFWHDEAFVVGCPAALRSLGEALLRAADGGKLEIAEGMTADGEGYVTVVLPMSEDQMRMTVTNPSGRLDDARLEHVGDFWKLPLPYTDHKLTGGPSGVWPDYLIDKERFEQLTNP